MKRTTSIILLLLAAVSLLPAQSPQSFRYQAVIRDASGEILANGLVNFRMSIHNASASGTIIYQETFTGVSTNQFGLTTLSIGSGTPVIGNFSNIDWGNGSKYLEVELELIPGNGYTTMGTSKLISVPYALYAKSVESAPPDDDWVVTGADMHSYHSGNTGIGIDNPHYKLEVYKASIVSGDEEVLADETIGTFGWHNNDSDGYNQFIGGITMKSENDEWNGNNSTMNDAILFRTMRNASVSEKMRITSRGYVGIGLDAPSEKLEVDGNIKAVSFIGDGSQLTNINGGDNLGNHIATQTLNMSNYAIINLKNPTNPQEAATKAYVDNKPVTDNDWGVYNNNVYTCTGGIYPSGNVGIGTSNPANAKLEISGATGVGIRVNSPGHNGMWIETPAVNGIYVNTPQYYGFAVDSPVKSGLYVDNSTEEGIWVQNTGKSGMYIGDAAYFGINIINTGFSGIKVDNPGTHGVDIYDSGGEGIQITGAALNGIKVTSADYDGINATGHDDGVHAITTDYQSEWGVYTPDKIRADMGYSGTKMNGIGKFVGNGTLEKGDLVCIAGGYEEDALGRKTLPVVYVEKANPSNAGKIFGVVDYKVQIEEKQLKDESEPERNFKYQEGNIATGDYLSVTVLGTADVKIEPGEPVKPGETLTVGNNGARKVKITKVNGISVAENTGILGKALENSSGKETVKVFVNCK